MVFCIPKKIMKTMKNTKEVIVHTKHYVSGVTLDFGAGTAKYQHIVRPCGTKYIAFDIVAGKNIDVVGDVLNPPFANNSFDTIISTQVLEHVEKPWILVAQMGRILKSGGICITTAPFLVPYHADPYDFFRYTVEGMVSLFENEGFKVVESGSYGKTFSVFSEMIHFSLFNPYNLKGSKLWAGRIMRKVEALASTLDRLVKSRVIYPNAYVVMKKN
jgi:SAM-dependent methyltransferase